MRRSRTTINLLDRSIPPGIIIWSLAWPTILEQVLQVSVTYVDSAMVGSLGAHATAAISVPTSTIWLVNGWMNAFAIGFSVLMARNLGAGNQQRAKQITKQALFSSVFFGLGLTFAFLVVGQYLPAWIGAEQNVQLLARQYYRYIALGYLPNLIMILISTMLRFSGEAKKALYLNALNNVLNILFNVFFIYETLQIGNLTVQGLGLGVQGAAMATTLACTITSILLLIVLLGSDNPIRISITGPFTYDMSIQKNALRLGIPVALERSTLSFGQIVFTKMVGTLGTTALAAHFLANTAESITYLPPSGFSTAATTLVAQSLGSNDKDLARKFANLCTLWGTLLMSFMGLMLYVFAPHLMRFFTTDEAVITLGTTILRIEAFAEPAFGLSMLAFGVFRGAGDTRRPFYISIAGMWLLRLPLAYLLLKTTTLGLLGIWIAMASDLTLRGIICLVQYRKFTWLDSQKETH